MTSYHIAHQQDYPPPGQGSVYPPPPPPDSSAPAPPYGGFPPPAYSGYPPPRPPQRPQYEGYQGYFNDQYEQPPPPANYEHHHHQETDCGSVLRGCWDSVEKLQRKGKFKLQQWLPLKQSSSHNGISILNLLQQDTTNSIIPQFCFNHELVS